MMLLASGYKIGLVNVGSITADMILKGWDYGGTGK